MQILSEERPRLDRPQQIFDGLLAVGYLILSVMFIGTINLNFISVLVLTVAISIRRFSPGVALSLAWLAAVLQMVFGVVPAFPEIGILIALYAASAYGSRRVRRMSGISVPVGTILATLYLIGPSTGVPIWQFDQYQNGLSFNTDLRNLLIFFTVILLALVATWLAGLLRRSVMLRQQQSRARQLAEVEVIAEQERTRIARDMHDVVAHSLTVMVAQADGARYLAEKDPAQTQQALETIASTAREALAQVRVLLAELRHRQEQGPQPELDAADDLFAQFRLAGLTLDISEGFTQVQDLGSDRQRALYRILQEALTNALRHGDPALAVTVEAEHLSEGLRIQIRNAVPVTERSVRYGHGIIGMTERAALVGAELRFTAENQLFTLEVFFPSDNADTTDITDTSDMNREP